VPHSAKVIDPVNQAHYAYMIRLLKRLQPSGSGTRLLDFGCGGGQFLVEAQAEGFDVSGLEINRDLANFVTDTYTFPVFRGLLNDPSFGLPQFDLILSSQVFEHLSYPREILERLVKHLNSPGLILIEVPNLLHIRERLRRGSTMDDSHLVFFSKDSLSGMMESVGLEIIKVQEGMRLYRRLSGRFAKLPDTVHDVFISTLGRLRVRTGLSVIGVKI
jgi:2-polyprenyl-3-methyl-5-hydroxy-6-metoxy-1,4-benzoquinol methylase